MRATKQQWDDFIDGFLWSDMKEVLEDWVEGIKADVFSADNMDEVRKYQGRMEALQYFLALPQTILESLEHEENSNVSRHDQTS